ncbi:PAS domain-containing protein, partial [Halotia wernerae UHCC 0503]|nr:PAS domain-containing protein [Halotia wernerae UHCC 0503]
MTSEIGLEDILITKELSCRSPRKPDLQAENQALHTLARQQLTESPQPMLKILVTVARDLCLAGTAGVSLLEFTNGGKSIFRWVALAGALEQYEQMTTPGDFSPCGLCLERRAPQLFLNLERYFTYFQQAQPAIIEDLVIPLVIDNQQLGTIWIVSHDPQRQFDGEDVRLMTSLADLTAAALQSSQVVRQAASDAQQALHQKQVEMQSLITNMPGMVYRYLPGAGGEYCFTFVSSGCHDLFEVEPSAALQDADLIFNLIHPDDQPSFMASVAVAVENFLPWEWQGRIITPSGQLKWIQGRSGALQTEDGDIWDGLLIDITAQKQAEQKIKEQAALLDITTDAILVKDFSGQILFWNQGAERLYGWQADEILGHNAEELLYKETSPLLIAALQDVIERGSWQGELDTVTKSGQSIIVESRWTLMRDEASQPKSILSVDTDITEKKQLQSQFLRTQRLESIGTLASGIAHDLNNILTPIMLSVQTLAPKLSELDARHQQLLKVLEDNSKRGADLVKQILTFARGSEGKSVSLQIEHLLLEIEQILSGTLPKSIIINKNLPTHDLWTIKADSTQIHQVLMNL